MSAEPIPLARPVLGEAEERAVLEVLRSGQLSLGPRLPEFEQRFAARVGAPLRVRGLQRHRRPAPRAARGRRGGRRRGRDEPVLVRRLGQRGPLRARAAGVRRHRSGHAEPRPGRGRGRRQRAHEGAAAGSHLRLPGRHARVRAARRASTGWRSSRTPARRSARVHADGAPSARAGIRRCSASTPTSS